MPKQAHEAKPYEWDYDGACAPDRNGKLPPHWHFYETFSLGIFQWLPKSRGKGLKRGKVVKRIKGYSSNPAAAHDAAQVEVDRRNAEQEQESVSTEANPNPAD